MGGEGALLEPPAEEAVVVPDEEQGEEAQEVPSVFSVINRYLVGAADVSPPAEDGSRILRLFSASGGAVIEVNLAPQLCDFVSAKLVEVEVIEEGEEAAEDAGSGE